MIGEVSHRGHQGCKVSQNWDRLGGYIPANGCIEGLLVLTLNNSLVFISMKTYYLHYASIHQFLNIVDSSVWLSNKK